MLTRAVRSRHGTIGVHPGHCCRMNFCRPLFACYAALLVGSAAIAAPSTVKLIIDMRAEISSGRFDPRTGAVGVRGGSAPLSWSASVLASDADRDGRYEVTLRFEQAPFGGQPVSYKVKIERPGDAQGGWEAGRNHPLRLLATLPVTAQTLERAYGAEPLPLPLQRSGDIDRLPALPSRHVDAREVQVWLPPRYALQPQRRYPVLYLHDGQNVFDAGSAGAEWQVDETAQRLVLAGAIEPMIVVAVASTGRRIDQLTPVAATRGGTQVGGGAAGYASFLVEELKPIIDARYRTKREAQHTAVGGSSLGGLVTMWLLRHHAATFGAGLVVSPAVWWADEWILQAVAALAAEAPKPRVWLDIGALEGDAAVAGARRLRDLLQTRGWRLRYLEQPGAGHDELAWASRVEAMLRFLYGRPAGLQR